jgi:HPt (histidine-containing phosphotransfer) domain-containing protein
MFKENIPGICIEDGLKYCGTPEVYEKFIRKFYNSIDDRAKEIETAYETGDYELYTIKVHALKSTARIMGAAELSGKAMALEEAGNNGDLEFIKHNTKELLDDLKGFKEKLSFIDTKDPAGKEQIKKEPISSAELKNAYEALLEFIPQMDCDAVEMVIGELKEYELPGKDEELLKKLEDLLGRFDWEAMEELIKGVEI